MSSVKTLKSKLVSRGAADVMEFANGIDELIWELVVSAFAAERSERFLDETAVVGIAAGVCVELRLACFKIPSVLFNKVCTPILVVDMLLDVDPVTCIEEFVDGIEIDARVDEDDGQLDKMFFGLFADVA